jgi:hypothetical protein
MYIKAVLFDSTTCSIFEKDRVECRRHSISWNFLKLKPSTTPNAPKNLGKSSSQYPKL